MRKILLVTFLFALVFSAMAQKGFIPRAHHLAKANDEILLPQKVYGKVLSDTLWYEDFDSLTFAATSDSFIPAAENFPAVWSSVDVGCAWNQNWRWDKRGPRGIFTSPGDDCHEPLSGVMNSPTKNNGWMTLEGGYFHMAADCSEYFTDCMDTYLQYNEGIDFSSAPAVHISYYQWSRFCCGYGSDSDAWFEVSTDEGNTWNRISVHQSVINVQFIGNVEIDISSLVAGESNVWFRFHLEGLSHYHWEIDDVAFGIPADNDIRILDYWNDYLVYNDEIESTNDFHEGFYAYPWFLIQPFEGFHAAVQNFGSEDRAGITYHVDIERNGYHLENFETSMYLLFSVGAIDTFHISQNWLPEAKGLYEIKHYVTSTELETITDNDTSYHYLNISDSILSVIDFNSINDYLKLENYINSFDHGDGFGFHVNIPDPMFHGSVTDFYTLNGISFFFNGASNEGELEIIELGQARAIAKVYRFDSEDTTYYPVISSSERVLTIQDTMSSVYLPFIKNDNDEFLDEGGDYLIALHFYGKYIDAFCGAKTWTIGQFNDESKKISEQMCVSFESDSLGLKNVNIVPAKPAIALDISFSQPYVGSNEIATNEIEVYPNPTNGLITIETNENSEITIQNMAGQVCYKTQINSSEQIDLSHLPKGVYVVNVISANGQASETLIIQ